jgi:hypothetical protein
MEIAGVLASLGALALHRGDRRAARGRFEEALARAREVGNKEQIAGLLLRLAGLAHCEGDEATAHRQAQEALHLSHQLHNVRRAYHALEWLSLVAGAQAEWGRAVRLAAAARRAREQDCAATVAFPLGAAFPLGLAPASDDLQAGLAAARRALGEPAFAAAWAQGQAVSLEQAIASALEEMPERTA